MNRPSEVTTQPLGLGVASVVLGVISTLLFFLPILATPIGLIGLALAVIGCGLGVTSGRTSLRWSAVGLVVSGLAHHHQPGDCLRRRVDSSTRRRPRPPSPSRACLTRRHRLVP